MELPLYLLVVTGSLFWFILIIVFSILAAAVVGKEKWGGATIIFVLGILFLVLFTDLVRSLGKVSWISILFWVVVYVLIGILWSFIRWAIYVLDRKKEYLDLKKEWCEGKGVDWTDEMSKELKGKWVSFLGSLSGQRWIDALKDASGEWQYKVRVIPRAWDMGERIIGWMMVWPWSMLNQFVCVFLYKGWRWVFDKLRFIYDKIADWLIWDVRDG